MNEFLNNFGGMLSNNIWLALIMSFVAGIISSFSPCVLSTIPLVVGYVGGYAGKNKKLAFKYSLIFCVGIVITYIHYLWRPFSNTRKTYDRNGKMVVYSSWGNYAYSCTSITRCN